jgi:GTP cyclohydrolase III
MQAQRKNLSAAIAPESYAFLEAFVAAGRAANLGEAVDQAVEAMRRSDGAQREERAEPYAAEPSSEEVAQDRATVRAMHESNPDLLFDS